QDLTIELSRLGIHQHVVMEVLLALEGIGAVFGCHLTSEDLNDHRRHPLGAPLTPGPHQDAVGGIEGRQVPSSGCWQSEVDGYDLGDVHPAEEVAEMEHRDCDAVVLCRREG